MLVLTQTKKHNRQLTSYYANNSLLIQFILSEFIEVYQIAAQIQSLVNSTQTDQALFRSLTQLLGLGAESERYMVSRWTKGPLVKLHHYCRQFYENGNLEDRNHLVLYNYVHKTWLAALYNWELLHAYQKNKMPPSTLEMIQRSLKQLMSRIKQMAKHISRVMRSFAQDENVIYFLFRKRKPLDEIYGVDFIDKVFKMTPTELLQLLLQRFTQRGFDHLIPSTQSV